MSLRCRCTTNNKFNVGAQGYIPSGCSVQVAVRSIKKMPCQTAFPNENKWNSRTKVEEQVASLLKELRGLADYGQKKNEPRGARDNLEHTKYQTVM